MRLKMAELLALMLCGLMLRAQTLPFSNRSPTPLFKGASGRLQTEIHFDPTTAKVTLKLVVQDPNGYFIPNIRPENFVVYENGVRQNNISATVEHASVTIGLLMEHGGRYQGLSRKLVVDVSRAGLQLVDMLENKDKVALWIYGDSVKQLTDFSPPGKPLDNILLDLKPPELSETNLYDAVIFALKRMQSIAGRKALMLISTCVDTFSHATYDDVLDAARSGGPIYVLSLATIAHEDVVLHQMSELLNKIDWAGAENRMLEVARTSGGRLYSPKSTLDLSAIYDDIMENLKVRYVVTYQSSSGSKGNTPRTVRVELVDPKTGKPLQIMDQNGRPIHAAAIAQAMYVPNGSTAD